MKEIVTFLYVGRDISPFLLRDRVLLTVSFLGIFNC
jgi:hypothetical protein